ncbi:MAG: hypothetical protein AB1765_12415 [Candidatus Hydrogenedentota bacterium]
MDTFNHYRLLNQSTSCFFRYLASIYNYIPKNQKVNCKTIIKCNPPILGTKVQRHKVVMVFKLMGILIKLSVFIVYFINN